MLKSVLFRLTAVLMLVLPGSAGAKLPAGLGPVDGKVVWVDFWASWCAPCRRSFPWLNEMMSRYGDQGLQVIGVNVDKTRRQAESFLAETPARFDLRFDPAGALAEIFGVQAMPSSFLLDSEGNVIATHLGFRYEDADEYEAAIVEALEAAGSEGTQ